MTTYYIDSSAEDGGNGLTPESAWNTLASVTGISASDVICLKRGSSFTGMLTLSVSGVTLRAYDASPGSILAENPIIDANGAAYCINAGSNTLILDDLSLTGSIAQCVASAGLTMRGCTCRAAAGSILGKITGATTIEDCDLEVTGSNGLVFRVGQACAGSVKRTRIVGYGNHCVDISSGETLASVGFYSCIFRPPAGFQAFLLRENNSVGFDHCVFHGKGATARGIYTSGVCGLEVYNSIFDTLGRGFQMLAGYSFTLHNCCFHDVTAIFYDTPESLDVDSIEADPLFCDAATEDYHLEPTSPCIDEGYPSNTQQDYYGCVIADGQPDIGCAELGARAPRVFPAETVLAGTWNGLVTGTLAAPAAPTLSIENDGTGTSVTCTVEGDAGVTNTILYQTVPYDGDDWTDGPSRVGDGEVQVTGLTEGVRYRMICRSSNGGASADSLPHDVQVLGASVAATGLEGLSMEALRALLAEAAGVQAFLEAADEAEALLKIFTDGCDPDAQARPRIWITETENFSRQSSGAGRGEYFSVWPSGSFDVWFEADTPSEYQEEDGADTDDEVLARNDVRTRSGPMWFRNAVETALQDAVALSGVGDRFVFHEVRKQRQTQWFDRRSGEDGDFFQVCWRIGFGE